MTIEEYKEKVDKLEHYLHGHKVFPNKYGSYPFVYKTCRETKKGKRIIEFIMGMASLDSYKETHTYKNSENVWNRHINLDLSYRKLINNFGFTPRSSRDRMEVS